ncbi:MAG: sigma-70 family RNA polymerase sigma factor [Bacteroidota bacterium]
MKLQFEKEQDLLNALRSKSPAEYNTALEHLYKNEKLKGAVRKQVIDLGGNDDEVHAILNDTLLVVFNHLQSGIYDPEKSRLNTYIVAIAKKKFFTKHRSDIRRVKWYQRSADSGAVETITDMGIEMDRAERKALLTKVLSEIDPKCQKITELQSIGYSLAEIADQFNYKNQNAAKSAAKDCREKFRKRLEANPDLVAEILE